MNPMEELEEELKSHALAQVLEFKFKVSYKFYDVDYLVIKQDEIEYHFFNPSRFPSKPVDKENQKFLHARVILELFAQLEDKEGNIIDISTAFFPFYFGIKSDYINYMKEYLNSNSATIIGGSIFEPVLQAKKYASLKTKIFRSEDNKELKNYYKFKTDKFNEFIDREKSQPTQF